MLPREDITGFVLAGGLSQRMGRDKAQIPWESETLLTHAVGVLEKVVSSVFVVGAVRAENPPAMVILDKYPGCGPLAGIHAALANTSTDWNLVLAVDLPLVSSGLAAFIASESSLSGAAAVVPKVSDRLQPLCAAYHRRLLPAIQKTIEAGDLSIHRLLERLNPGIMGKNTGIRVLEEREMIARGFRPEMLMNVNTPEDLERATSIAKNLNV